MTPGHTDAPATTIGPSFWRLPSDRRQLRRRAVRDGLVLAGLMTSAFILVVIPAVGHSLGYDAYSYWFRDLSARYAVAEGSIYALGAFRYAPPIGQLFGPLGLLPWWVYLVLWLCLMVGTIAWLGGRWTLVLLAMPPVALELYHGNIHLFMAAAIALGFRSPAVWSFVLLTKVTPGVGLLWFAVRREWPALAIALGASAAISIVSFALAPSLWSAWLDSVRAGLAQPAELSIPPPLVVRLPVAALLVAWGARTARPWTVAVSAMLALPNLWPHGLVVALGAVPVLRAGRIDGLRDLSRPDPIRPDRAPATARGYTVALVVSALVALGLGAVAAPLIEPVIGWASSAIAPSGGLPPPP